QLLVCLGALFAAFCFKLAFPRQTQAFISSFIDSGMGIEQVLSDIGAGLRDVFSPVGTPKTPGGGEAVSPTPAPADTPGESPSTAPSPAPSASAAPIASPPPAQPQTMKTPLQTESPPAAQAATLEQAENTLPFECALPVEGVLSSRFGSRRHPVDGEVKFHYGLDFEADKGSSVKSFAAGKVFSAGKNDTYGNYLLVEHSHGYISLYAHLSATTVKKNQSVKMGQEIGRVGDTGIGTGPHLHFELRLDGEMADPLPYLTQ
ncbi:MAG: M23 family metallopeptidase, partial [Oscillospiraceae bacterium]|nr:M23 family metallopeptidase [Oscillospiraceae bacterium]